MERRTRCGSSSSLWDALAPPPRAGDSCFLVTKGESYSSIQIAHREEASMTVSFQPPVRTLMGPGPSDIHPRVLQAMARPTIGHLDPAFVGMMDELKGLLQYAFRTENALTLPISAPGSAACPTPPLGSVQPTLRSLGAAIWLYEWLGSPLWSLLALARAPSPRSLSTGPFTLSCPFEKDGLNESFQLSYVLSSPNISRGIV